MKIKDKEYNQIIQELGKRIKDAVFINIERKLKKEMCKKCVEKYLDNPSDTEITYSFTIIVGDLWQILGGTRRKKIKRKKSKVINY